MTRNVAIVGGGPAGLMAAELLSHAGVAVHLYDAMPSVGRKFLLAGKGGLNLTHSEPAAAFSTRYGARQAIVQSWLDGFGAPQLRAWAHGLGVDTFVGSSGRIFPVDMKAAPLLRAWLHRLRHPAHGHPVQLHMRHRWVGWSDGASDADHGLSFDTPGGPRQVPADAVVLALGGASWPRLGSDGSWVDTLRARGVPVAPLLPSNCGFDVAGGWSSHFAQRFAGHPLKSVALDVPAGPAGPAFRRKGEFVATMTGIEGSLVYAASALLRDTIAAQGHAALSIDLLPDFTLDRVLQQAAHPRGARSLSSHLKSRLGIDGIKAGLLYEILGSPSPSPSTGTGTSSGTSSGSSVSASASVGVASRPHGQLADPALVARTLKALPLVLSATRPVAEAISSAGGVAFDGLDERLMVQACPGVFCAGEMLDWEAPTGGYLLTAAMASGRVAALGVLHHLGIAES